jgi:hypothetical protein
MALLAYMWQHLQVGHDHMNTDDVAGQSTA